MANNYFTQQALAQDSKFRLRVQAALATVAWQVLGENPATAGHQQRAVYARQVLANLPGAAANLAPSLVMRTNLMGFNTSYDFAVGAVVTLSTDADIESQISSDWTNMAGA